MIGGGPIGELPIADVAIPVAAGGSFTATTAATLNGIGAAANVTITGDFTATTTALLNGIGAAGAVTIEAEQPQFFGGAAWNWPKSRRDRRWIDDAPEPLPVVETPAPPRAKLAIPETPAFDVAGALAKAREAAKSVASDEVTLRRAERREAAAQKARAIAVAQAAAKAKADADDEDDIAALLAMAW